MLLLVFGFWGYERRARLREVDLRLEELMTPLLPEVGPHPRPPWMAESDPGPPPLEDLPPDGPPPEGPPPGHPPPKGAQLVGRPPDEPPPHRPRHSLARPYFAPGPDEPLMMGATEAPDRHPIIFDQISQFGCYFVVWGPRGRQVMQSSDAPEGIPMPGRDAAPLARGFRTRGPFREFYHKGPNGAVVLLGRSTSRLQADLSRLVLYAGAGAIAIVVAGLAGGWWVSGRALRPIGEISATAERIAAGDLSQRIPCPDTGTELGRLVGILNQTFQRLEEVFAQQARFTSDAAHELRTPVSVLLAQTQSTLSRERPAAEYLESLEACQRAGQRMRRLINALLELARMDAGQTGLRREMCQIANLVRECAEQATTLARERNISVETDLEEIKAMADPVRLAQVITNLLVNAVYYNRQGGLVRVRLVEKAGEVLISVSDTGQGISAADLPHIFERFYRADKARSGDKSCSGLGLSICKSILDLHGGRIEVTSQLGAGSTFTIHLPAQ